MWGPPSTGEVILTTSVLGLLSGGEVILALKPALKIFCSTVWGPPSTGEFILTSVLGLLSAGEVILALKPA